MKRVLDVVVSSEENRLAMGRALIDAQLENNSAAQAAEQKQYLLEQRILELEGKLAQEFAAQVSMLPDGLFAAQHARYVKHCTDSYTSTWGVHFN